MEWNGFFNVQVHQLIMAKTKQSRQVAHGKKSRRKIRAKPGKRGPPRAWPPPRSARGSHHGPWWPPRSDRGGCCGGCPVPAPCAAFWLFGAFALGRGFCSSWGILGLFASFLLILLAHTSLAWIHLKHFSQNLGLDQRNLQ